MTQVWYGYKIEVLEGEDEDFVAGVVSNDENYPDIYYVSADLRLVDKL